MGKDVCIVGGYGGMGQIFARLFKNEGHEITITGPTETKGADAASKIGVKYVKDNVSAAKQADVVVITVPIAHTKETIEEVAPHVKDGALLMDLTSVKGWPCELMLKHSTPKVEVIGTHPVFGPRVGSVDGQVFVLTPVRGQHWMPWLEDILVRHRAKIIKSTPQEHDRVMGVVQGLTHFAYISVGKTLKDLEFDVKRSRDFSSPVYDMMLDMVGRIIGQNPHLYAEIQMMNPDVAGIHDAYLNAAQQLSRAVKDKNEEEFVRMMVEAAKNFDDTERAMGRSDKAISSLAVELNTLKQSQGKEVCLRHIYSGTTHLGVVESVTADEVTLLDGAKKQKFKLSNLRILDDAEKKKFKIEKYQTAQRDYSLLFPDNLEEELVKRLLISYLPSIVAVEIKDVYKGDKIGADKKSICYGVEIIAENLNDTDQKIKTFFKGLGGMLR